MKNKLWKTKYESKKDYLILLTFYFNFKYFNQLFNLVHTDIDTPQIEVSKKALML